MRSRKSSLACAALLAIVALGCGGGEKGDNKPLEVKKTVPARGIVKYQGNSVKDAAVTFLPLDNKTVSARGTTDGVGSFILTTYNKDDGAPVGKYKVLISVNLAKEIEPGVLAPEPPGGFKSPIPTKYNNVNTTDILMEVKEGDNNDFTIELK